ncbi:hypothetical protein KGM_206020 [Danaus plexippus plexippus]|uniref:Uncharacterized protein n=1 Tax=Danaus plexippus plexippus TaxID=278856 RepID=A0A212F2T4_DANPL|nr:hypothetical protein KGM_206020 [Danaus plexippus plexippus]
MFRKQNEQHLIGLMTSCRQYEMQATRAKTSRRLLSNEELYEAPTTQSYQSTFCVEVAFCYT